MTLAIARAVLLLSIAHHVIGKVSKGVLPLDSNFSTYVDKFCFGYTNMSQTAGRVSVSITGSVAPTAGSSLSFLLFDDEPSHWTAAQSRWNELTCDEFKSLASTRYDLSTLDGSTEKTILLHEHIRPRFWFAAFVACNVEFVEPVAYEVHFENTLMGWQKELGVDQEGITQVHFFAALSFGLLSASMWRAGKRAAPGQGLRARPLLRLLVISSALSCLGASLRGVYYWTQAQEGKGEASIDLIGLVFVCAGKAMLLLLQLLTAKGWVFFHGRDFESMAHRHLLSVLLSAITVVSVACEIHADYTRDWTPTLYLYEKWSGTVLLMVHVVLCYEACRSLWLTWSKEQSGELQHFYRMVLAASIVYFMTVPALCLLSPAFDPWVRDKYIVRIEVLSRLAGTILLALCLKPSRLDALVVGRLKAGLPESIEDGSGSGLLEVEPGRFVRCEEARIFKAKLDDAVE